MSSPGIASSALNCPGRGDPRRISMDEGEPIPINDPRSACDTGVGMAVVASPNRAFMSSNRTLAVSGYKNQTAAY